jgi:hypothetical protein
MTRQDQTIRGERNQAAGRDMAGRDLYEVQGDLNFGPTYQVNPGTPRQIQLPSLLAQVVPVLADTAFRAKQGGNTDPNRHKEYTIQNKITYNNIQAFKRHIDEYAQYGAVVDRVYRDYDADRPLTTIRLMEYFKGLYIDERARLLMDTVPGEDEHEIIRNNADGILRKISDSVTRTITESGIQIATEDLTYVTKIVICHAFIDCKILEKPPEMIEE